MSNGRLPNDEDFFAHTRMSLGDHIEELRGCLWRAVKWFFLAMVIGVFVSQYVLDFIQAPIRAQLEEAGNKRAQKRLTELEKAPPESIPPTTLKATASSAAIAKGLNLALPPGASETIELELTVATLPLIQDLNPFFRKVNGDNSLIVLSILEGIIVWIKVAIYCGIVIAAPLIFREIWSFVAAGLYPQEKALVWRSLPLAIGLFLAGVALCQFVLLPIAIHYLLSFDAWLDVTPQLRLSDWLSFAIFTPIVFGIAFQTPLVMFVLDRVGVVPVTLFIAYWRIATFVIILLSGFLAPSPDPVSMLALGLPIVGLYWLGIGMCIWWPRPKVDLDVAEEEQQNVEV